MSHWMFNSSQVIQVSWPVMRIMKPKSCSWLPSSIVLRRATRDRSGSGRTSPRPKWSWSWSPKRSLVIGHWSKSTHQGFLDGWSQSTVTVCCNLRGETSGIESITKLGGVFVVPWISEVGLSVFPGLIMSHHEPSDRDSQQFLTTVIISRKGFMVIQHSN